MPSTEVSLLRVPAFATRGIPWVMTRSPPHTFWFPPTFPKAAAAPQLSLVSSGPQPSALGMQNCAYALAAPGASLQFRQHVPWKKMDKKALPMTFFSSVCPDKKETSSAWSTQCQTRCSLRMWSPQLLMSILSLTFNWVYTALFLYICFRAEQTNFTYMTSKQLFTFLEAVWRQ